MPSTLRLISTDFDGTVYEDFADPPVPHALQARLAELRADGAAWVVNTGRHLADLLEAMARARLAVQPDFVVAVEREIYRHDGARYVPVEPWNTACARDQAEIFGRISPALPGLVEWLNGRFKAAVYADPWSPLCVIATRNEDMDRIQAHLEEFCRNVENLCVVRNDVYARFSHTGYSKGTALGEVARLLGVGPEAVFAAGDHLNDLPMLDRRRARWIVTPANGVPAVQAHVREQGGWVTQATAGRGVWEALEAVLGEVQAPGPGEP